MCLRLTISVRELPNEAPSFPHPSSQLNFTINYVTSNVKVEDITLGGEPLDMNANYKIAVTDFVAGGKERFKFIKEHCKVLTESEHAEQFSMWILDYFRQKKGQKPDDAEAESRAPPVANPKRRGQNRSSFLVPDEELMINMNGADNFEFEDDFADLDSDTLRKVCLALTSLSEESSVFAAKHFIKTSVKALLQCDRAAIFSVDQIKHQLIFLPDGATQNISISMDEGIAGHCATTGTIVNIPDAYQDLRFNKEVDKQTGYRTRNILACPVKRKDGRVVAVMQAVNKEHGSFDERDTKILSMFGKQTAIHLGHAEMFEALKRNQEATHTLLRVAREMASDVSMDMKTMVACIMSGASQLLRCDRSSLFLVDGKNQEMWTIVIDPATGSETIIRLPLGTGVAGHTAVTGQILNIKDAYDSPLFNPVWDKKNGYKTTQMLCVPIFTTEGSTDVLGVLQFINKLDDTEFNKEDETMAEAFASFAGISISNTQEIDLLKLKHDDKLVQEMPPVPLGRIKEKGGWNTVKRLVKAGSLHMRMQTRYASIHLPLEDSSLAKLTAKSMTGNSKGVWQDRLRNSQASIKERLLDTESKASLVQSNNSSAWGSEAMSEESS
eukprot:TRINITY_DN8393_c0_g2_i2.p1 TRINITY_DN8393_c0_g2~~TRINITY_DN8393_c0_g2_i2.p1  ORF type:complete len:611 (+),score=197.65 TRINITY_DN8393_c0_g2_i2:171-2003(+)